MPSVVVYRIRPSSRRDKKYMVELPDKRTVHFGAAGYSDYTMHKDDDRRRRYLDRHQSREDWSAASGTGTAGFWARHILWNQKTLAASARATGLLLGASVVVSK